MKNIDPISDHFISSVNEGKWSIRVTLSSHSFIFLESGNSIRLVSSSGNEGELGVVRNQLIVRARLKADEEYARYQKSKETREKL